MICFHFWCFTDVVDSGVGPEKSIGAFPAGKWPGSGDWHSGDGPGLYVVRTLVALGWLVVWAGSASSSRLSFNTAGCSGLSLPESHTYSAAACGFLCLRWWWQMILEFSRHSVWSPFLLVQGSSGRGSGLQPEIFKLLEVFCV